MDKKIYDLILEQGVDEEQFLTEGCGRGMEVKSNLNMFDGLLCMLLTEDEAEKLRNSPSVKEIMMEFKPEPTFYPTGTTETPARLVTRTTPSPFNLGSTFAGTHFFHSGEQGGTNVTAPIGFFTNSGEIADVPGQTITQTFTGEYVDIVAIEAGSPSDTYDGYESHPDFQKRDPQTFNITATNSGSSSWLLTGTDRNGSFENEPNKSLVIFRGDTINITNNASAAHPIELVQISQVPGVTNQGAFGGQTLSWTPAVSNQPIEVTYRCTVHTSSMAGSLTVSVPPSRFKKTDWSVYDPGAADPINNQITSNTEYFDDHGIGVLSVAGGSYCGWAKNADLRVIYTADGIAVAYNAVLEFHKNKPINPETGRRNATIVTGAFGYPTTAYDGAVPIDSITRINAYDEDNNLIQIDRPSGGWGTDFTPFVDNLLVPRIVRDPSDNTEKWCIAYPLNFRFTVFDSIMNSYNAENGIYHFKSAGNYGNVGVKPTDPRWNTNIENTANINFSVGPGSEQFFTLNPSGGSAQTRFPLRVFDGGATNMITVAAFQNSTINPLLDSYSSRGPFVDVAGTGAFTWSAYPEISYPDGQWGYFSGTSCAAPQAAGVASLLVENFFVQRGTYPSIAQLKELINKYSKPLEGEPTIDWSDVPPISDFAQPRLYFADDVYSLKNDKPVNGGMDLSDLHGTPSAKIFAPWGVYMGTGQYIADPRGPNFGKRPTSGQTYPRRKIRVGA